MASQPNHASVTAFTETRDDLQRIAKQLSAEKGVTVTIPNALRLIVNEWKDNHPEEGQRGNKDD